MGAEGAKMYSEILKFRNVLISQASGQSKAYVMALLPIICH